MGAVADNYMRTGINAAVRKQLQKLRRLGIIASVQYMVVNAHQNDICLPAGFPNLCFNTGHVLLVGVTLHEAPIIPDKTGFSQSKCSFLRGHRIAVTDALFLLGVHSAYSCHCLCHGKMFRVQMINLTVAQWIQTGTAHHIRALLRHGGDGLFRYVLLNDRPIPEDIAAKYLCENAVPVVTDGAELRAMGLEPRFAPVASWKNGLVRHDPADLAGALMTLYYESAATRMAP